MAKKNKNQIEVTFNQEVLKERREKQRKPRKTNRRVPPDKRGGPGLKNVLLTKEQMKELEKLAAYLPLYQIADYLGIHRSTIRERILTSPEVRMAYEKGRARAIGEVAQSLISKAKKGDFRSQQFYLQTQARWTTRHEVNVTGNAEELTDEELARIATGDNKS